MKQTHCTPTWTTPSKAAAHAVPLMSLQQAISCCEVGRTITLAMAAMDDKVPRRTHHGERPAEVPRVMILVCWGR